MDHYILFLVIGTPLIFYWASVWHHSGFLFGVISIIFTPVISGLILLTFGHRKGIGKCPNCGKWRKISDTKCMHCEHESTEDEVDFLATADQKRSTIRKVRILALLAMVVVTIPLLLDHMYDSFFPPISEIKWSGIQDGIEFETIQHGKIESGEYIATVKISNHLNITLSTIFVTCRIRSGFNNWSFIHSTKDVLESVTVGLPPNRSFEYTFIFPFDKYKFITPYIVTYSAWNIK